MRRLAQAGFKRDFVKRAILPEWWEEENETDSTLLPEIEIRVARFLKRSVSDIRNTACGLNAPLIAGAQLRRVGNADRDQITPAIHSAMQVAGAVVRSLRDRGGIGPTGISDASAWRAELLENGGGVSLMDILSNLWGRGIPVILLEGLPSPGFQGLACVVNRHPVVMLGYKYDAPGRIAFIVSHEVGHIATGDCTPDSPIIDEDFELPDDAGIERRADLFATRTLIGSDNVPVLNGTDYRQIANEAARHESQTGADATTIIYSWARRSGDYRTATMAVKALYRASGGRALLREFFDQHVDLDSATDTDQQLLRCVYGNRGTNATAG